ncbi:hypothetical protein [Parabacteroides sp. PF5-6]|uniref:hypothetical protein n=1 Tax=Parabacteroides sp. PF5-6 TaxID=1742403 RepID=UPI0024054E46|nr:hypothetical protein [Parabacteroides sp. PF5-6]MDF9829181.1 hypothetical protein [Parabacteroides sp. PF5-6]
MKKITNYWVLLILLVSVLLPACEGLDNNYSTNPSHRLSFSADTLSFDTVFTTIGSATREFMIYNRNSEALNMESILLAGAGSTGFRINVDGRKGDSFYDIGILPNDSMYVFVEVTIDPNGTDQPLLIQDSVLITVNGIRQQVLLEAVGQDVNLWKTGRILTRDTLLTAERPYLVYDSLVVAPRVNVEIAEGAIFYMHDKANVVVYGTLSTHGSEDAPVLFRGDRLDFILNDLLPYDRTPGQWGGVFFMAESFGNRLDHTIIRNGTTGITCLPSTTEERKLTLSNAQVTNMAGNLFSAINCDVEVVNSELSNATENVVALLGGNYRFAHSTLANYMSVYLRKDTASLGSHTLLMSNSQPEKQFAPLKARFDNCIIDGYLAPKSFQDSKTEILLDKTDGEVFEYTFNHCVLKTDVAEDDGYNKVILVPTEPSAYQMFRMTGSRLDKYMTDFRLDSVITVGVGSADPTVTVLYPVDRYGVDRLTSPNGPTIGAYEFTPKPEE